MTPKNGTSQVHKTLALAKADLAAAMAKGGRGTSEEEAVEACLEIRQTLLAKIADLEARVVALESGKPVVTHGSRVAG